MNNKERVAVLEKVLGLKVEPEPDYRCIRCFKVLTCLNYAYEGDVNKEWICNQCLYQESRINKYKGLNNE